MDESIIDRVFLVMFSSVGNKHSIWSLVNAMVHGVIEIHAESNDNICGTTMSLPLPPSNFTC
jgi:hypothetical protein